ncbi:protein lap1 isoform X2 [Contarinia nasturtii]|nr:protein lap1 isoform X2 [Contarinia nasturtii]
MPWWTCLNCASKTTQTNCNDIIVLDYAHHSLHDVPADVFQYERTLEELYLSSNRITELPRQLFLCHGLKVLDLSDNDLSSIPTALSSLTNLGKINLARNSLNHLTDSIVACKSLTHLDLSLNSLEKLPDAITSLFALQELYLNDTILEYLPANFGRLTSLRILELRDNNLITLPKSMNRLQHLERLDIGNNEFTELPEVIGSLTALTELWVDGNRIRHFNCNVSNLKELVHFDASNNLIQHLPTEIGNWQRCQEMCLSANEIEELPFSIGMMKSLIVLKVDENQLQELPDSICEMESLEELMVSHNDLFKLPSTIGLLRRLRFLTADENLLRSLPNEICSCSNLTILSARGNKLTKIPVDIGRLTQLRVLNIVNNFLSNLPVTILNLSMLNALWISDNQSQPLMPLQKEFHKESQCYYLTCYLLPQVYTSHSTSTNAASTSTAPESTYDYLPSSICDTPQQNMHIAALENLSLAAIAQKRKRNICFASDPPQEIVPNLRLMRSPTPYPKELRMMQAKFAANKMQHQQLHTQRYAQQENDTNNLDPHSNTKPLNTINTENMLNMQTEQTNISQDHPVSKLPMINNIENDVPNNINKFDMSMPNVNTTLPNTSVPRQLLSNTDLYRHTNINNDLVQYDSVNANFLRRNASVIAESNIDAAQQQQQQSYSSSSYIDLNSINKENELKMDSNNAQLETESNQNNIYTDKPQQQPPPYHIAKAFTKKSKQDLLIYDIYRNNYQQQQNSKVTDLHLPNDRNDNLKSEQETSNAVDSDNNEVNIDDTINQTRNNSLLQGKTGVWLFGEHKNPTVMQLSVPKVSSDIGFKIVKHLNQGIFISDVETHSSAHGKLIVKDKILDVDGVDFTKISLADAETVLSNAGSVMNIMISRSN